MKIIKSKGLTQKILLTITLIVLLFNILLPTTSRAEFDWGGTLWNPVQNLVCGLGDVTFNFLQASFIANAPKAVYKATEEQIKEGKKPGSIPIISGLADAAEAFWDMVSGESDFLDSWHYQRDKLVFPSIYYSVENIFANKIPAFDVNFINPSVEMPNPDDNSLSVQSLEKEAKFLSDNTNKSDPYFEEIEEVVLNKIQQIYESSEYQLYDGNPIEENDIIKFDKDKKSIYENGQVVELNEKEKWVRSIYVYWLEGWSNIPWGDVNVAANEAGIDLKFNIPSEYSGDEDSDDDSNSLSVDAIDNIARSMQETIATWYNSLRNLAIVAMLSILVYIAIRIIISSASEEAKYKIMLKDWLVAICLLFIMHYIMAFSLNITQNLTDMLSNSYQEALESYGDFENTGVDQISSQTLATSVRYGVTLAEDTGEAMSYTIMYALLVIYTIIFTWQYLKRVIYMAFLTIISPLVAMTYPIDKINDGKAQGFDMWLKEYIFNLLIQPVHMLIFMILATSAMDLFTTSIIYSLVVLGFLLQAIKILKKFFGFDSKAPISGGGLASGFAGGAVFSTLLNATRHIPQIGGGKSSKDSSDKSIRTANNSIELPTSSGSGLGNLSTFGGSGSTSSGRTKTNQKRLKVAKKNNNGSPKIKSAQVNGKLGSTFRNRINQNNKPSTQSVKTSKNTSNQPRKYETARRTIRGISNLRKRYINVPKILKTTAKVGVGVIGAGTLGTIGIAGGLASDDYSDVAKYGLAGVAGGYAVGKTVGTSAANVTSATIKAPSNIKDTFEQGYYGSDYSRVKSNRDYRNSKEIREHYKDKYGADWEKAYKKGIELREKAELDSQKDIEKAIKLTENGLSIEKAADLMLFRKKAEATYSRLTDEKSRKSIEKDVSNLVGGDAKKVKTIMKHLDSIR